MVAHVCEYTQNHKMFTLNGWIAYNLYPAAVWRIGREGQDWEQEKQIGGFFSHERDR